MRELGTERILSATALYEEGLAAFRSGDQERSRQLNDQVLIIGRELDDPATMVRGLIGLSRIAFRDQDHATVRALCAEATPYWEQLDDTSQVTSPIHLLAESARLEGNLVQARVYYDQSIAYNQEVGNEGMLAIEFNNKALLEIQAGNLDEADGLARRSLQLVRSGNVQGPRGLRPTDGAYCLLALGAIRARKGDAGRAASLLAAAEAILTSNGAIFDPGDQPLFDESKALATNQLGEGRFVKAWQEGAIMSADQAFKVALGDAAMEPGEQSG